MPGRLPLRYARIPELQGIVDNDKMEPDLRAAFGEKAVIVCNPSNGGAEVTAEFDRGAGPT